MGQDYSARKGRVMIEIVIILGILALIAGGLKLASLSAQEQWERQLSRRSHELDLEHDKK